MIKLLSPERNGCDSCPTSNFYPELANTFVITTTWFVTYGSIDFCYVNLTIETQTIVNFMGVESNLIYFVKISGGRILRRCFLFKL